MPGQPEHGVTVATDLIQSRHPFVLSLRTANGGTGRVFRSCAGFSEYRPEPAIAFSRIAVAHRLAHLGGPRDHAQQADMVLTYSAMSQPAVR